MPKVSVIIPSYNHASFVVEAVRSALAQSERDIELVIVDDGSTDGSLELLASVRDPRVRLFAQANHGAHAAINRGLRESRGRYLAILNSDDVYHPDRLEKLVAALEADPQAGLAGSYIEVVDAEGRVLGVKRGYNNLEPWPLDGLAPTLRDSGDLRAALLTENYWATTSNFVFSRRCYDRVGGFRPLRYAHDWDFALRVASEARLLLVPEPLLRYRLHHGNTIGEDLGALAFEVCWCLAVHLPRHVGDPWFRDRPDQEQVEALLHSIYTFGNDRVLSVMLVDGLAATPDQAMRLLEPGNPRRDAYLRFIRRQLSAQGPSASGRRLVQRTSCRRYLRGALRWCSVRRLRRGSHRASRG